MEIRHAFAILQAFNMGFLMHSLAYLCTWVGVWNFWGNLFSQIFATLASIDPQPDFSGCPQVSSDEIEPVPARSVLQESLSSFWENKLLSQ
jgi:hypothetical protein